MNFKFFHQSIIGHSLKNLVPSQKTLRPTWCPKLLRAWAKRLMDWLFWRIIVMWHWSWDVIDELFKKKRRLTFIF